MNSSKPLDKDLLACCVNRLITRLASTGSLKKRSLSKARLAVMLKTSRSQVDRLLDPTRDVTLSTLQRAAAVRDCLRESAFPGKDRT